MPEISVIIPVYNVEKYLPECLDSCINQTLNDIEIICINDKSTDNCDSILSDYAGKDKRIRVINHKTNLGLAVARNTGIINATGKYLLFLDSDDMLTSTACEELYNRAEETNADIVFADFYTFYNYLEPEWEASAIVRPFFLEMFSVFNDVFSLDDIYNIQDKKFLYKFLYDNIYTTCVWGKLYRTSIFKVNNILAPNLRCAEDFCVLKEFIHNSKRFTTLAKVVMLYRKHKGGFTSRRVSYVFDLFKSYEPAIRMFERTGYLEAQYTNIHRFYLDLFQGHYKFCPRYLLIKFWFTIWRTVRKWDLGKINIEELSAKQKKYLKIYSSSLIVACIYTLFDKGKKIKKGILKLLPYCLVHKTIENINRSLREEND